MKTIAVRPEHRLDAHRLGSYLQHHIDGFGDIIDMKQFSHGQSNPTYLISTSTSQYVLRRKPTGVKIRSAHDITREYEIMKYLQNSPVPVPRVYLFCEDENVCGSAFYVMEYVEGRVFTDPSMPELTRSERAVAYNEALKVLSDLHNFTRDKTGNSAYQSRNFSVVSLIRRYFVIHCLGLRRFAVALIAFSILRATAENAQPRVYRAVTTRASAVWCVVCGSVALQCLTSVRRHLGPHRALQARCSIAAGAEGRAGARRLQNRQPDFPQHGAQGASGH